METRGLRIEERRYQKGVSCTFSSFVLLRRYEAAFRDREQRPVYESYVSYREWHVLLREQVLEER